MYSSIHAFRGAINNNADIKKDTNCLDKFGIDFPSGETNFSRRDEAAFREILFESQLRRAHALTNVALKTPRNHTSPEIRDSDSVSRQPINRSGNRSSEPEIKRIGETIDDIDDLTFLNFGNIIFENCTFRCDLDLTGVRCRYLSLRNCRIRTVLANDAQIDGTADFRGVQAENDENPARLILRGARIGGSVELHGAKLIGDKNNDYPWALDLAQTDIGNAVSCLDKPHEEIEIPEGEFQAEFIGGVTFNRSTIRNTVWFRGVHILQHVGVESITISFQGAEILGDLLIDGGAKLDWTRQSCIDLLLATVKRNIFLDLTYWPINSETLVDYPTLLILGRELVVGGSAYLNVKRGAPAGYQPVINFAGSRIGGEFKIRGEGVRSLVLRNANIKSDLYLGNYHRDDNPSFTVSRARFQFKINGEWLEDELGTGAVDLLNTQIGGRLVTRKLTLEDDLSDIDLFKPYKVYSKKIACYPGWFFHQVFLARTWQHDNGCKLAFSYLSKDASGRKSKTVLDGTPLAFRELNKTHQLSLETTSAAFEYLTMFCANVLGGKLWAGRSEFRLRYRPHSSDPKELQDLWMKLTAEQRRLDLSGKDDLAEEFPERCNLTEEPGWLQFKVTPHEEGYQARGVTLHQGFYFLSLFIVKHTGEIIKEDEAPITLDGKTQLVNKNFIPITSGLFHPSEKIPEPLFSDSDEQEKLSPAVLKFVSRERDGEFAVLTKGDRGYRLRINPYRIDLRNTDASILDDLNGTAWSFNFCDQTEGKERKKVRIELENFTYDSIFQDIETFKPEGTERKKESTKKESTKHDEFSKLSKKSGLKTSVDNDAGANSSNSPLETVRYRARSNTLIAEERIEWINRQLVSKETGETVYNYENYCAQPYRHLIAITDRSGEAGVAKEIAMRWIRTKHKVEEAEAACFLTGVGLKIGHFTLRRGFQYGYGWLRACLGMIVLVCIGMICAGALERNGLLISDGEANPAAAQHAQLYPTSCKGVADFFMYSADLFIPFVDFQQSHRCRIAPVPESVRTAYQESSGLVERLLIWGKDPRTYEVLKGVYILIGWLWTALTGLTVTGLLRRAGLRE